MDCYDLNRCIIGGYVADDVRARVTGSGKKVTNFELAVRVPKKQLKLRCKAWGDLAVLAAGLKKGSYINVDGSINQKDNARPEGDSFFSFEVVCNRIVPIYDSICEAEGTGAYNDEVH